MLVGVRKKHWLLVTLSITGVLLFLVFTTKSPGHSPARVLQDTEEVELLPREAARQDNSIVSERDKKLTVPKPTQPSLHLSQEERDSLAKQGVLMVEDFDSAEEELGQEPPPPPSQQRQQQQHKEQQEQQQQQQQQQLQQQQKQQQHVHYKIQQQQQYYQKQQYQQKIQHNQQQQNPKNSLSNPVDIKETLRDEEMNKLILAEQEQLEREKYRLQEHHLREQRIMQEHLRAEEQKKHEEEQREKEEEEEALLNLPMEQSRNIPAAQRTYKGNRVAAASGNDGSVGRLMSSGRGSLLPKMTYDGLWKMGENIARHSVRREFLNSVPDTRFTPGEIVDPSQMRRIIILSTWRSGSSFLGDLLRSYPGTYFSFEPLHHLLKNLHLQDGPLVDVVLNLLRSIMTCNYSQQDEYVNYLRNNTFLIDHNTRIWNSCARNRALCFDKDYLSAVCKYMPVNVMKTVRMGLAPVVTLLEDPSLDLRVIHLVRDPRGSLHSRMQLTWCHSQACSDPATVCDDLMTDLKLSEWVKERFPERYLFVRYEDLGLEPEETARKIFKFLELTYHKSVAAFVRDHTSLKRRTKKKPGTYSTYRDSKSTTFAWRGALNFTTLEEIQNVCREPMNYLKLKIFKTEEDYINYTIPVLLD